MLDKNKIKLGIAPIAWAEDDMPEYGKEATFLQIISEIALSGYEGTEVGCKYPADARVLKEETRRRGLAVITKWFSSYLNEKPLWEVKRDFRDHMLFLKRAGATLVNVSDQSFSVQHKANTCFADKPVLDAEGMRVLAEGLNELGKMASESGMQVVYHHHMTTTVQTEEEIGRLMAQTDPRYVSLIYDTGHLAFSGEDYLSVLEKQFERIKLVHLKNVRAGVLERCRRERISFLDAVLEGVFTIPGDEEGSVDFPAVFRMLETRGYQGWLVVEAEQNPYRYNPLDYAMRARAYIKEQTGI